MPRPALAEWAVLDRDDDPTPGEADILQRLATEYDSIADDAESAMSIVQRLQSTELGEGKAMDKLRQTLDELPVQITKLRDSYRTAATALQSYAPQLETHQDQAQRALQDGQDAKARLDQASAEVGALSAALGVAQGSMDAAGDDEEARKSAQSAVDKASGDKQAAQARATAAGIELAIAQRLAQDASDLRVADATSASTMLADAQNNAVDSTNFFDGQASNQVGLALGFVALISAFVGFFVAGPAAILVSIVGLGVGLASLGLTIAKIAVTGEVDKLDLVFGIVGAIFGGFSLFTAFKFGGGLLKSLKDIGRLLGINKLLDLAKSGIGKLRPPPFVSNPIGLNPSGGLPNIAPGVPNPITLSPAFNKLTQFEKISAQLIGLVLGGLGIFSGINAFDPSSPTPSPSAKG